METQLFDLKATPIDGINLIEASAGTGKTYTIEGLFLRLLLEKGIQVENILVVTFTEAATAELRERIATKIRSCLQAFEQGTEDDFLNHLVSQSSDQDRDRERLKLVIASFDEAAIYTIHGFCQKMLIDFAFESQTSFDSELVTDQEELIEELAADYWRNQLYTAERLYNQMFLEIYPTLESLIKMAKKIISRPVKHILPRLKAGNSQGLYQEIINSFEKMKATWALGREFAELLKGNAHWKKPYINKLDLNLELLHQFFRAGNPFETENGLDYFTPEKIQKSIKKAGTPPEHSLFEECEQYLLLLNQMSFAVNLDFIDYAQKELRDKKQTRNLRSFDDLLKDLHHVLMGEQADVLAKKIQDKFAVALIDEFQDTDPIQYEIFKAAFKQDEARLFFIGDPKQSIYNFRGADIFAYLNAENDADHKYTLEINWRSDRDLVKAVNKIFTFRDNPFVNSKIAFPEAEGSPQKPERSFVIDAVPQTPMNLWFIRSEEVVKTGDARDMIAQATATRIAKLLNQGVNGSATIKKGEENIALQPKDIAVLVRTHKEALLIQDALWQRDVPSVLNTKESILESAEFNDVRMIAAAVADYKQESKVRTALLTDVMGANGTQVYQWTQDESVWEDILNRFKLYHDTWSESGFYHMMRLFLQEEKIRSKLLSYPDGERRLTNLLHLLEVFHQAETASLYSMTGLLQWASKIHRDGAEQGEHEIRLETDADALKIMTVHTSKGLEFPLVFVPYSWGGQAPRDYFFHDPDQDRELTWDLEKTGKNKAYTEEENLAENLRLLYVALTRAKHCCYVSWGKINRTADSAYSYLFHRDSFKKVLSKVSCETLWADLEELRDSSENCIHLEEMPQGDALCYQPQKLESVELRARHFQGNLRQGWGISSFSGLSSRKKDHSEGLDHDQHQIVEEVMPEENSEPVERLSLFSMPGGAKTGECFHEMLENLDFQEKDQEVTKSLVQEKLEKFDFDLEWAPVALKLMQDVASRKLTSAHTGTESFSLSQVLPELAVEEMPFHFPITKLRSRDLAKLVAANSQNSTHEALVKTLEQLEFNTLKGFMKGFIDLVFCHEGRFYILDWKTNKLGEKLEDYTPPLLREAIEDHLFNLQYYIYTVALHKYLKLRMPGIYDFDQHFGGVYYFFLRGIHADPQVDTGVLYESLSGSGEMIDLLEQIFSGEVEQ